MRAKKILCPVSELLVGEIILISESLLLLRDLNEEDHKQSNRGFVESVINKHLSELKDSVFCCVISKKKLDNGYSLLVSFAGEIVETTPLFSSFCVEIHSFYRRENVPVSALDLEIGDVITVNVNDSFSYICFIEKIIDRFSYGNRELHIQKINQGAQRLSLYHQNVLGLFKLPLSSVICTKSSDLVYMPTSFLVPLERFSSVNLKTRESFAVNISLLKTMRSQMLDQKQCSFSLEARCKNITHNSYRNKYICTTCIEKIAAIQVFANLSSIRLFRHTILHENHNFVFSI